jgi:hypothetical protein
MLSDHQIERYSRHVILPEIGGRGQERLLESSVSIHGSGDAALLCASYLAGAGVGGLWLARGMLEGPAMSVLAPDVGGGSLREALSRRNPDCRWLTEPPPAPSAVVAMGADLPEPMPHASPIFWGGGAADVLLCVRFPPGRACAPCLERVGLEDGYVETPAVIGTVLALLALRSILGLERGDDPWIWRLDGSRPDAATTRFPSRPGCRCDSAGPASGKS